MQTMLCGVVGFLLRLRYRIVTVNARFLVREGYHKEGGVLFLPNHPAEVDPLILSSLLGFRFAPRPVVVRDFYDLPYVGLIMRLVRGIPTPNCDLLMNDRKVREVEKAFKEVEGGLRGGDNFLIYPSGRLQLDGYESIGGNSFVQRIFEMYPEVRVVLIRTTGLWGSTFSRAITGRVPDVWKTILSGCKEALKSALFFMPRRAVTVEFAPLPGEFPKGGSRLDINRYLEGWYNRYTTPSGGMASVEPLRQVPFNRFTKRLPVITRKKRKKKAPPPKVRLSPEVRKRILSELARLSGREEGEIEEAMSLSSDLGLDSLDYAGIRAFLAEQYRIESISPEHTETVADLFRLVCEGHAEGRLALLEQSERIGWPAENCRPALYLPKGETVQEVFLSSCSRMERNIACGDAISGLLSYGLLKRKVIVLARMLQKSPGPYVAILLPSSVSVFALIVAVLMAKKVPVLLNWTAGVRSLNYAHILLRPGVVISSGAFLQKSDSLDLGAFADKTVLLEEMRERVTFREKATALFLAGRSVKRVMRYFGLREADPTDPAVILFTSGTESYPKAVPLSHANLLSNQAAAMRVASLNRDDILLATLPPFHSFGFSVTGIFPLLVGVRVFYSPDPTDGYTMARECYARSVTVLCSAPSFYRNLFRVATDRELATVRLFVTGAEKMAESLIETIGKLESKPLLLEGYGITECSPIVTVTPPDGAPKGVGLPLPGVKICVIDPDTCEVLRQGKEGEICIAGPGVFNGYIGDDAPDPFIKIGGERWYKSGDLGVIEPDGTLIHKGRLRRFMKIGAEMISLSALEEELIRGLREKGRIEEGDETPRIVACAREENGKDEIVLVTTLALQPKVCNAILRVSGFGRIVKIGQIKQVDEIPLTGTGKVRLCVINEMING